MPNLNEDMDKVEAIADQVEGHRLPWEKMDGNKTLKEVIADLREHLDRAEGVFDGSVTGYAHAAATVADHMSNSVKILAKGLTHADKIPGLGVDFLQDVRQFQSDLAQYGKDMALKVPQDVWSPLHQRASVSHATHKMAELGSLIDVTAIEKSLSGSKVVDPKLSYASGLSLLNKGIIPPSVHREMGLGDPKAVSGDIKALVDEKHERKVVGSLFDSIIGPKEQRYAIIGDSAEKRLFKVALSKGHQDAKIGDYLGGMRKPGSSELVSSSWSPKIDLKNNEIQR